MRIAVSVGINSTSGSCKLETNTIEADCNNQQHLKDVGRSGGTFPVVSISNMPQIR